jgi:hypothetical protein
MPLIADLGRNIYQIDVCDQEPERTSCYLVVSEKVALIETGPAPGTFYIMDALKNLGIPPEKIDYIIVTLFTWTMRAEPVPWPGNCRGQKVWVHPRAPGTWSTRQARGWSQAIYGDSFERLFGEILPVPGKESILRQTGGP